MVVKNTKEGYFLSICNENGVITICINISEISVKHSIKHICHATRMEEGPKVTLDIQCLWRGGGVALTLMYNYFLLQRGSGGARAITA